MILDGKVVANEIKQRLKDDIDEAVGVGIRRPRLVIISVGDDPASKVYVRNKLRVAEEVGRYTRSCACHKALYPRHC